MTDPLRAVFDTNVFISAFLSRNPSSPTKELIERWKDGELILLISDALADELIEKLLQKGIPCTMSLNSWHSWAGLPSGSKCQRRQCDRS